ncbi:hypothetical protein GCM10023331_08100 [Algivirga pacifica]|uniref:Uncharacterized protein n=2 Tax=Algivirga pacifica TaxID=1162670 RepID=A0ABP9D444_9BACT
MSAFAQQSIPTATATSEPFYLDFGVNDPPELFLAEIKAFKDETSSYASRGIFLEGQTDESGKKIEVFREPSMRLEGHVKDSRGVQTVSVFVDGREVKVNPNDGTFVTYLKLKKGQNKIQVKAEDTGGMSTEQLVKVFYEPMYKESIDLTPTMRSIVRGAAKTYCDVIHKQMSGDVDAITAMFKLFGQKKEAQVYDDINVSRTDLISISRYVTSLKRMSDFTFSFPPSEAFINMPMWGLRIENGAVVSQYTRVLNEEGTGVETVAEDTGTGVVEEKYGIIRIEKQISNDLDEIDEMVFNYIVVDKRGNIINILKDLPAEARPVRD